MTQSWEAWPGVEGQTSALCCGDSKCKTPSARGEVEAQQCKAQVCTAALQTPEVVGALQCVGDISKLQQSSSPQLMLIPGLFCLSLEIKECLKVQPQV